jgi:aspartate racemase
MNTSPDRARLGILAGMGPWSTAPFLTRLLERCRERFGAVEDGDFPHLDLMSLPTPYTVAGDTDALAKPLCAAVRDLERNEPAAIGVACNTAHEHLAAMRAATEVPVVDMIAEAANRIATGASVMVLASPQTLNAGLYAKALHHRGATLLDMPWQPLVDETLRVMRTGGVDAARSVFARLIGEARKLRPDVLLVGCMDLSALPPVDVGCKVVEARDALIDALLDRWDEARRRFDPLDVPGLRLRISNRRCDVPIEPLCDLLADTYWACDRTRYAIERSVAQSRCYSVLDEADTLVAFARFVTDGATFSYLCDVVVRPDHRSRGVGTALVRAVLEDTPAAATQLLLSTRHAEALYAKFGFSLDPNPTRFMTRFAKPRSAATVSAEYSA